MVKRNKNMNSSRYMLSNGSNSRKQERPNRMRGPRTRTQGVGDQNLLHYSVFGNDIAVTESDVKFSQRYYIPGVIDGGTQQSAGAAIASLYSTGVFKPGCKACWVPNLGSNANGRVYMAYLDNPEQISVYASSVDAIKRNFIKSCGNMVSGSVSQPLEFNIPSTNRRKRFDVNKGVSLDINQLDRSCQGALIFGIDGVPAQDPVVSAGSMLFHDTLHLEGIVNVPS